MIRKSKLKELCDIFAGGDKPLEFSSTEKDNYIYPVFSNGSENGGLVGFSTTATVKVEAVTIAARGSVGHIELRTGNFTPIIRLITLVPKKGKISAKYLCSLLKTCSFKSTGSVQSQLTVPDVENKIVYYEEDLEFQDKTTSIIFKIEEQIVRNNILVQKLPFIDRIDSFLVGGAHYGL